MANDLNLYDLLTKKQIFLEGVKASQADKFDSVALNLSRELRLRFSELQYDNLGGMTKRELDKFVRTLRNSQSKIYSPYTRELINQIKSFIDADNKVTRKILKEETGLDESEARRQNGNGLYGAAALATSESRWSLVKNQLLPSNGMLITAFVTHFANSAMQEVEQSVKQGYANKSKTADVLRSIVGTSGKIDKIRNWHKTVSQTSLQHVSSVITSGVSSFYYTFYQWVSVIDNRTTAICRDRNGNVYLFANGPVPPAHDNCRSHIAPLSNRAVKIPKETYYGWISRQSENVQNDILGRRKAESLRKGDLNADDFEKFVDNRPVSIEEFINKF